MPKGLITGGTPTVLPQSLTLCRAVDCGHHHVGTKSAASCGLIRFGTPRQTCGAATNRGDSDWSMADVAERIVVLGYSPGWVVHLGVKTKTAMAHRMICGSFRLAGRARHRPTVSWGHGVMGASRNARWRERGLRHIELG